jgi:hypothetical protein
VTGTTLIAPSAAGADPPLGFALGGVVTGFGLCRASAEELPGLRRRPGPVPEGWDRVPPSLLRYSDEQTIVGVAAVFEAVARMGGDPARFEGWGAVAAPRYLGRANLALALRRFDAEGVWGTSPHLIPHFALHSPSGTISLALGLHGPNLGVGGGLHSAAEGFMAALTWLATGCVPGAWLVLSGWSPELRPAPAGGPAPAGECLAVALALVAGPAAGRPRLRVAAGRDGPGGPTYLDLARLAEDLGRAGAMAPRTIATDPTGRLRVELSAQEQERELAEDAA